MMLLGGLAAATVLTLSPATVEASAPPPYEGPVYALGDSVMLGAEPCLEERGYDVDAVGSRMVWAGIDRLRSLRRSLPPRVVVHMGTNGGLDRSDVDEIIGILRRQERVVLVTIQLPNDYGRYTFEDRTNRIIRAAANRYDTVRIVEWNVASDANPRWLWGDHTHLPPAGCRAFARMVDRAVRTAP